MLEKRTSAERLEESGRRVVDWLNSPRASRHPVTKLFVLAQTMIHAYEHSRFPFDRGDFEGYQAEINRIAGNYPGVCALAGLNGPRPESAYFRLESLKKVVTPSMDGALSTMSECWPRVGPCGEFAVARCRRASGRSTRSSRTIFSTTRSASRSRRNRLRSSKRIAGST